MPLAVGGVQRKGGSHRAFKSPCWDSPVPHVLQCSTRLPGPYPHAARLGIRGFLALIRSRHVLAVLI